MFLLEHESKDLLEKYGIKTAKCVFVRDEDRAVEIAKSIGFPVVMKVCSREVIHKSRVGGVVLDIRTEKEVRDAFKKLMSIRGAEGVNIQPMLPKGLEVVVGVIDDNQFGSVLMFGLGGVFVEVLRDVTFRLIPITRRDAIEMVKGIRGYKILKDYIDVVVDLLLKVNDFVEREEVVEMDLNPVFIYKKDYAVVDARIRLGEKRKFEYKTKDIRDILHPRSIAVIGASANPMKVGYSVLRSLKCSNVKLYPVNPRLSRVEDLDVYPSILNIKDNVDLAVIAVPANKVLEVALEAVEKGVKGLLVISSGFKEAEYEDGKIMQNKLSELAEMKGVRIIGPNSFGFVNAVAGINVSFTPMFSEIKKGRIALISQSGGICHYIVHKFRDVGFSYVIHLGNRCDVDFADVFNFLKGDENTDAIAVYVEGVDNGRSFYKALKDLCSIKPVVVMKAGKSEIADKASLSHTGSIAGDYEVFRCAVEQAKAVFAEDPVELMYTAIALELLGKPIGGIAILTIQAGLGIVASDIIRSYGGELAEFSDETVKKLKKLLPPITMRENPVDLSFSGLNPEILREVFVTVSEDENVGLLMFIYAVAPPSWAIPAENLKRAMDLIDKPIIVVYSSTPDDYRTVKSCLERKGVFVCDSLEYAARVAAKITECR